jgi:hypothetical protein
MSRDARRLFHKFDGETVRLMCLAFAMALTSLRYDCPDPIREALAAKIKAGGRNPDRLCDDALKSLRLKVNDPRPPPLPASPLERQSDERPER